ncbi:hypothetical protein [Pseudonocardia nigra]|uniref:hypothetical protein n=1 Tax=Pseudonocardia nigra TaxID=1921578 RepID=UPI001C5F7B23|nr:hypothetical protein [Pseudonocardia nigra]
MSPSTDPTHDAAAPPTAREITALTARLRELSARGWDVDPAERAAFVADKDALIDRIRDASTDGPAADRSAAAEQSARAEPVPEVHEADEVVSRAEAAERLVELGHDWASAEAMVTEYLHDTSRAFGVPVYQWGLDQHDVDDIARTHWWVHTDRGETLTEARERAARLAQEFTDQAAAVDRDRHPGYAEFLTNDARTWAERGRTPEPFTRASHAKDHPADHQADDVVPDTDGEQDGHAAAVSVIPGPVGLPAPRQVDDEQEGRDQLTAWHTDDHINDHAAAHADDATRDEEVW